MGASYLSQILLDQASEAAPCAFDSAGAAVPLSPAELDKRVREELRQQLRLQVRYSFSLVGEFRSQLASGATAAQLAFLLRAVLQVMRATFSIATMAGVVDHHSASERALCLSDLAQLLNALLRECPPPAHELAHGLDAVIVHLVQLTQVPPAARSADLNRDAGALPGR